MHNCGVFISLLTSLSAKKILAELICAGCLVEALDKKCPTIEKENGAATVLAIRTASKFDYLQLRGLLITYMDDNKISYYSIVIIDEGGNMTWGGTNIFLDKAPKPKSKPVSYLKLVKEPSTEQQDNTNGRD